MNKQSTRLVPTILITNMIPPYRVPVYERLDQLLGGGLHIVTLTASERNRQWHYAKLDGPSVEVARGCQVQLLDSDRFIHFNTGIGSAIRARRPEAVIVGGWDSLAAWNAVRVSRRLGAKVVLWSGSHRLSSRSTGAVTNLLRRRFVAQCDAFVTYGTMATEYLAELGARRNRIITSSNAVDSEHFAPNKELRHQVRSRNQVHEKIVVLFSGQLIRRKGLETLISAISRLGSSIVLWVVGAGEGRARYESLAQKLIPNRSRFFGHLAYDTLNEVLNASDMLVMPSLEEVWGLVLNEAMSAGVPVIASSRAGATADLVVPGETGLSVEPEDVPALAKAIEQLALDDSLRHTLGENARSRVLLRGTKEYAQDIAMAVRL